MKKLNRKRYSLEREPTNLFFALDVCKSSMVKQWVSELGRSPYFCKQLFYAKAKRSLSTLTGESSIKEEKLSLSSLGF